MRGFRDGERHWMVETRMSTVVDNGTGGIFSQEDVVVAAVPSSASAAANQQRVHQTAQSISTTTLQPDTDWRIDCVHVASRWQIRRILYSNFNPKNPKQEKMIFSIVDAARTVGSRSILYKHYKL